MTTVYIIHAEGDESFLKQRILRYLPSIGYEGWVTSKHIVGAEGDKQAIAHVMDQCRAVLIIISPAILDSSDALEEINIALASQSMQILIQIATFTKHAAGSLLAKFWDLPKVDLTVEEEEEANQLLINLLPPVGNEVEGMTPDEAVRIEWNEEIFSIALARATACHAHSWTESLVSNFINHLKYRQYPYSSQAAYSDLQKLRQEREFGLMCQYAQGVTAYGTHKDRVQRLFAQALIETGQYDRALDLLQDIINDSESSLRESFEARGLIGRIFKQRYVNEPDAEGAVKLIRQAIIAYESAYIEDQSNFWHGVNAASCILRTERDGIHVAPKRRAQEIAQQIIHDLKQRSQEGELHIWDYASQVEAWLVLGKYDEAEKTLEKYIHHSDMTAFEVSSTFRQFDQVLQLGQKPRGAAILARLESTMNRYRASAFAPRFISSQYKIKELSDRIIDKKFLVIRTGDSFWKPREITDLVVQSQMGRIITARGSDMSVRELLTDSKVISVEESRPTGKIECNRSIPFINIAEQYVHAAGNYKETGEGALIAVIDDGIDVLHKAFLDANGSSRIVGIWDQTARDGTPPTGFDYGAFHDESAIERYLELGSVPLSLGRNERGHGTHVASIAGGRSAGDFAGGVAPDAKLLIIVSASNEPVGYSSSHIDALHFIDKFATSLNLPVVVNVSQGMNAGAHDGKSALEVAFDDFSNSGRKLGRLVVKSAGNERDKGGHAKVSLNSGSSEELWWRRFPGADYTERIELWWSSADEIKFRLREPVESRENPLPNPDPLEKWSGWVGIDVPELRGRFPNGCPFNLTFTNRHIDNGDNQLLIELGPASNTIGSGDWVLEMRSQNIRESGEIHCWIERSQGKPSSFLNNKDEEMTLSIPGTAQSVITVGAVDASQPLKVGKFSSYGPTRDGQNKPLVCAPGVGVHAAYGGTIEGVLSRNGTSMAAPHVTGAIALLLSRADKNGKMLGGNQIASALRQKTQNYNGRWDRGQGYGVIDVSSLLAAFD